MCVTHLLGVYCDGVFLYLHVYIYVGSLLFRCLWYIFNVCNINMSCIFKILRFLSKGSVCALLIDIILIHFFCSLIILPH